MGVFTYSQGLNCQILAPGQANATVYPLTKCAVPKGLDGPFAVFVTQHDTPLSGDSLDRQNQTVLAGPAMSFSDNINDEVSVLVRPKP